MIERKALIKAFGRQYRLSTKKQRSMILDEFVRLTGFNRNYATRALRIGGGLLGASKKHRSGRRPYYDEMVRASLIRIWQIMDFINSKRLSAILPEIIRKLEAFGEMKFSNELSKKLCQISPAAIDRLLKDTRRKMGRKGPGTTRQGKYLIDKIPIKTFGEWVDTEPGFLQIDLLAHSAGNVYGGFAYTLNATDVCTGWTVSVLVRDKTKLQMLKALILMKNSFPFPIKGFHTDNGAEFINEAIVKFAQHYELEFTRGRPYKKNDNPHIEQKNYSVVRRNTGYLRYDKPEHFTVLRTLYEHLNQYNNYFLPIMVLVEKHRKGAKVTRRYDYPRTPFKRLLERSEIPTGFKTKIKTLYKTLNPVALKNAINDCQNQLINMAAPKRASLTKVKVRRPKEVRHTVPKWRRDSNPQNPNPFLERQRLTEMRRAQDLLRKIN